jgi:hypothetical protein
VGCVWGSSSLCIAAITFSTSANSFNNRLVASKVPVLTICKFRRGWFAA